jgi:hypothetical protein
MTPDEADAVLHRLAYWGSIAVGTTVGTIFGNVLGTYIFW